MRTNKSFFQDLVDYNDFEEYLINIYMMDWFYGLEVAIDELFEQIDILQTSKNFQFINQLFDTENANKIIGLWKIELWVALLSITLCSKKECPNRENFFNLVKQTILTKNPDKIKCLEGLD